MLKVKVILSWIGRVGVSGVLVVFLFLAPFTVMPSVLSAQANINRVNDYKYQGILELWHVETFEGGSVSRASFLQKQAISFEKQNKGVYIVVKTMSLEQLLLNLNSGQMPNMLSFGVGVGDSFVNNLCYLDFSFNVRTDLLQGGKFNNTQLAMPYILGGYALISQTKLDNISGKTGVGLLGTTNPLKAVANNNINLTLADNLNIDSYNAYDKFLKNSFDNLLGTQRDVYRINNRVNKGMIADINYNFLSGYTDLVQYISVFKCGEVEQNICKDFIKSLISDNTQSKLANINMFSVLQNKVLYTDDVFAKMEQCLSKNLQTENVFLSTQAIELEKNKYLSMVGK